MTKNKQPDSSPTLLAHDPAAEAHLFLASPDDWTSETYAPEALELLSDKERKRHDSMGHPLAQRLFLTGRALARSALSHFAGRDPANWTFQAGQHGRPRIVNDPEATSLDFNLAHTDRLVVCLITLGKTGGVDVESTQRSLDPLRMAEHSFAPEEAADLKLFEGQDRQDRFLAYWTLKEAYLKARGTGFSLLLDAAVFRFPEEGVMNARFARRTEDDPRDWQFNLFRAPGEHLVAVALRHGRGVPVRIVTRWAKPAPSPDFISSRPIVLEATASSRRKPDTR
ncbi:MAG: 4'-phosphopantetheinyl transferase superfamily protein [Acidobacteriota bacterium]|nr:4'-phosphopantetheinyl transferase superfamily protein [Acidobacteriota bacterium]